MERFIADLVKDFDSGKVDRREFCQTVAVAAMVFAAGDAAHAQANRGFKTLGINHVGYLCPDFAKARDFYTSVLGMQNVPGREAQNRTSTMFGPEAGKGGQYMAIRQSTNAPAQTQTVVDHVCYTISNWDEARVRGALKAKGLEPGGREGSINILDPFNYYVQLASAAGENAFKR
jgi:catechol 2,3-dioxygenase-like lactoylglutathione lyase family enzyme